ncbi:hypothetical protein Tco_1213837 [Tanacetum coccineum]
MAEVFLNKCIEKAQTESNLSITNTNNDMNIKLSKEFLTELQNNAYHGVHHEYVVDHIAMVLEMLDLINIPGVDSHQLRTKVFHLSLADDARQWWINEGKEKSPLGNNSLRNFSVNSTPNHTMEKKKCWTKEITGGLIHLNSYHDWNKRRMDDNILSSGDTTTDSVFEPYLKIREKNNTEKDDE